MGIQILNEAHGYKTVEIAKQKIEKAIAEYEAWVETGGPHILKIESKEPVRWVMSINDAGRFAPVIISPVNIMYWIHSTNFGVCN